MFEHNRHYGHHAHGDCCRPEGLHHRHFHRRFISREEKIARLEDYLGELRAEAKAVEEHLSELKNKA